MQRIERWLTQPRSLALLIGVLAVLAILTTGLAFAVGGAPAGVLPGGLAAPGGQRITIDQAQQNLRTYLNQTGNSDLRLDEIMAFTDNYYAIVKEKSTGMCAFELLVDPYSGVVYPEYGPNMMWNAKYTMMGGFGMMGGSGMMGVRGGFSPGQQGMMHGGSYQMSVSASQAQQNAQKWLDQNQPGSTTETPDTFYGYYTMHIMKDGNITGMLSVNGSTGQVWYHTWHGDFIQMRQMGG